MKTLLLFEQPKDSPSKHEILTAFKSRHGIETHFCKGMNRKDHPWLACHMPSARKLGYGVTDASSLAECFTLVGRLIDEAGIAEYGETEREAIEQLCHNLHMDFPK